MCVQENQVILATRSSCLESRLWAAASHVFQHFHLWHANNVGGHSKPNIFVTAQVSQVHYADFSLVSCCTGTQRLTKRTGTPVYMVSDTSSPADPVNSQIAGSFMLFDGLQLGRLAPDSNKVDQHHHSRVHFNFSH